MQADFPDIPADQILHIGDKIEADVKSPKSIGMNVHHYDVIPKVLDEVFVFEKMCGITSSYLTSLRKLAVHTTSEPKLIENQIGAGILGPVLTVSTNGYWISANLRKGNHLSFYARG